MKKWLILLLLLVAVFGAVCAETVFEEKYRINGLLPTEMTVDELYELEDTIVSALTEIFYKESEELPSGERSGTYIINPRTKKFHYPWCYSALQIGKDRIIVSSVPSELVHKKYKPCGQCNPYLNQ